VLTKPAPSDMPLSDGSGPASTRPVSAVPPAPKANSHRANMPDTSRPSTSAARSVSIADGDPDHFVHGHEPAYGGTGGSCLGTSFRDHPGSAPGATPAPTAFDAEPPSGTRGATSPW